MTTSAITKHIEYVSPARQRWMGVIFVLLSLSILVGFVPNLEAGVITTYSMTPGGSSVEVGDWSFQTIPVLQALSVIGILLGIYQFLRGFGKYTNGMLGLVAGIFVFAFLSWATAGSSINLAGLLRTTLIRAVPITIAAFAGILSERSGVVNIGIEGMLLAGAMFGALIGSVTNLWIGLLAGILIGTLMAWVHGILSIKYKTDQIISSNTLLILATGVTSFVSARFMQKYQQLNNPGIFANWKVPFLSDIPFIGPILFDHNLFVYGMLFFLVLLHIGLFYTRWGLRVRSVGEHPKAADTLGIDVHRTRYMAVLLSGFFRELPAWLVSAVIHLVAMLLMALWISEAPSDAEKITLATAVSVEEFEGDEFEADESELDSFDFDNAGAVELFDDIETDMGAPTDEAELAPVAPPIDEPNPVGRLPSSVTRPIDFAPPANLGRMFSGRNPEARARLAKESGGTTMTEAAVTRALEWLARHQFDDGHWSLHEFHKAPGAGEDVGGQARGTKNDVAATALVLLPFLGAGQTHRDGKYRAQVFGGLKWLVEQQKEDGDLRGNRHGNTGMYAHGQAAIALCEAYALTGDEQLRDPAQRALSFIVRAQHREGGWRYEPGQPGDTSVVGWQLMALKSGQMAYLHVPTKTFELAGVYLDKAQHDKDGSRYCYQPRNRMNATMTAEGLLCRQYLGWEQEHPGLKKGVAWMLKEHAPDRKKPNIYYWYYATQVMHHFGGDSWTKWNARMRSALVDMQRKTGPAAGSWDPVGSGEQGGFADRGGRLFMTSLAACILEVYYRHMPIYGQEATESFW